MQEKSKSGFWDHFIRVACVMFIACFYVFSFQEVTGQETDTLHIRVRYSYSGFPEDTSGWLTVDTSISRIHQFDAARRFDLFVVNTGNYFSPAKSLLMNSLMKSDYGSGISLFDQNIILKKMIRFYDTYTPFTKFSYLQGNGGLQGYGIIHSRNISPFFNVTFNYQGNKSDGMFREEQTYQKTQNTFFTLTSAYRSQAGEYTLSAYYVHLMNSSAESGGITNDSAFRSYSNRARLSAEVVLSDALNKISGDEFGFTQIFKIKRDSVSEKSAFFIHRFRYTASGYRFTDENPDSAYYRNIYLDSSKTNDFFKTKSFSNELSFTNFNQNVFYSHKKWKPFYSTGVSFETERIGNNSSDSAMQNSSLFFDLKLTNNIFPAISSRYYFYGARKNNGEISIRFNLLNYRDTLVSTMIKHTRLVFRTSMHSISPDFIYSRMNSNHLQWTNDFSTTGISRYSLVYMEKKGDVLAELTFSRIRNFVFFNSLLLPEQLSVKLNLASIVLTKKIKMGSFHFDNKAVLQYSGDTTAISLPLWMWHNMTYYEGKIFKKHLRIQLGLEIYLNARYQPDAYFAPFGIWYRQNTYNSDIYPLTNVFLNMAVKRLSAFVKFEHINHGYPFDMPYTLPYYPINPRTFSFGFNWMFFD